MSETPRTTKLVYEQECNFEVCWEEEYEKLERELIAAQQTIAQKDGEIQRLREALEDVSRDVSNIFTDTITNNASKSWALARIKGALSTPPSAVVPNYVNVAAEVRQQLENEAPKGK